MQEEVEQKTFNIVVSTTKLTARTILNAGKAAIQQQQAKMAGGKQSVRMLLRQNRGVSSVEIDKTNIRAKTSKEKMLWHTLTMQLPHIQSLTMFIPL